MKLNLMMAILSMSFGLGFSQTSFADEAMTHSANLGNTPMEGTETFQVFGGKEGLVKIMDGFNKGLFIIVKKRLGTWIRNQTNHKVIHDFN